MSTDTIDDVLLDTWSGCYGGGWKGLIADAAFAHPAKFSRALIKRIYDHIVAEGWAPVGSSVIDPFGGVALGGFDAMRHGLNWTGCELEEKFVGLGNQNIALWNERFSRMPNWGTAVLLQGDSRKLTSVIAEASCCVSSPPYTNQDLGGGEGQRKMSGSFSPEQNKATKNGKGLHGNYGRESEGQLGAMKEGDLQASLSISSPPYGDMGQHQGTDRRRGEFFENEKQAERANAFRNGYGESRGQLGAMKAGDHALAITSPPYNPPMSQDHNGSRGGQRGTTPSEKGAFVKYGSTEGQLEGMPMDGFNAAISSPPFPQPYSSGGGINVRGYQNDKLRPGSQDKPFDLVGDRTYQSKGGERSEGNLETMNAEGFQAAVTSPPYEGSQVGTGEGDRKGWRGYTDNGGGTYAQDGQISALPAEDFWSASRLILEQLHQVLVPGAHAVFVVKSFVRNKQIVDFPGQWAQLCETVGFKLLHDHHALLTEHYGTQQTMSGEDKELTVARKSFFRRLAESKGSPKIDFENVLCFLRP